jgi:hypothetical protein
MCCVRVNVSMIYCKSLRLKVDSKNAIVQRRHEYNLSKELSFESLSIIYQQRKLYMTAVAD